LDFRFKEFSSAQIPDRKSQIENSAAGRAGGIWALGLLILAGGCYTVRNVKDMPRAIFARPCKVTFLKARCEDGIQLALRRYQSAGPPALKGAVILCHGIGENGNIFDLDSRHSLARYLGGEGLDVWVADLRGCGPAAGSTGSLYRQQDWTIEDYITKDVPAILSAVRQATGSAKVVWVGHNLGANIALAYAAAHPEDHDLSIVSVGACVEGQQPYPPILADEAGSCRRLMSEKERFPSLSGGPPPSVPKGWEALFYNPEQMTHETLKAMMRLASSPVPPRVARQFIAMLRGGQLRSADGAINYAAEMKKVICPAYFICGKADNLADIGSVRRLYESVSSTDKGFRLFCLTNGDGADFGNADLLLGLRAGVDVYPEIWRWIVKQL
jgi:pimeloyl-ACP methyl ester carboxylesterase